MLRSEGCISHKRSCQWELHGQAYSELIRVSNSSLFKLNPETLTPNQTYTVVFKDNSGVSSRYSVVTNIPPKDGSCIVSPSEGIVIETQFQITCTGWEDEDSPLWYEFFLRDPASRPMLLFYGPLPYSDPLFLPPGREEDNFHLELFVNIWDALGTHKEFPLRVKVSAGRYLAIFLGAIFLDWDVLN